MAKNNVTNNRILTKSKLSIFHFLFFVFINLINKVYNHARSATNESKYVYDKNTNDHIPFFFLLIK